MCRKRNYGAEFEKVFAFLGPFWGQIVTLLKLYLQSNQIVCLTPSIP